MATAATQHALLLNQPTAPGAARRPPLRGVRIRRPQRWGPACGSLSARCQRRLQAEWLGLAVEEDGGGRRAGAASVLRLATPPALPPLPV